MNESNIQAKVKHEARNEELSTAWTLVSYEMTHTSTIIVMVTTMTEAQATQVQNDHPP